jgi:hypothetical protein
MTTKIQLRRDVTANWTSVNPSLLSGEPGYETNTGKLKIGDGTSNWTSLSYLFDPANFNVALANVTHANNTTLTGTSTYIRGDVHAYTSGGATHQQFHGFYAAGLTGEPTEYWAGRYATTTATGDIRRNFLKASASSTTLNSCFPSGIAQVGASTETVETTSFLQASGATDGTFPGTGSAMVLACATTTPSGMIAGNAISSRLALNTSSGGLNLEITANGSYSQARFYGTGNSTILYDSNSILTRGYADTRYIQSTANGSVSDLTVGGDLVVSGNLTINGTTTTLNSVTLSVDDKNIELGSVANATNVTADGGGLTLKGTTDKSLIWYNATSSWTSSENLSLVTGKSYRINDVVVLSNTALGTGVTGSCLTSVGTLSTGVWQGSTIGVTYGGTGATTLTGYVKGSGTSALTACATIPGADISGNITGNAAGLTGTLTVGFGGTGATTLTGYVKGSGTSAFTASSTIPGSDISGNITGAAGNVTGIVAIANGGTGGANATAALSNLGAAARGANSDITSLSGLTTALSVAQGGTGVATLTGLVKANGTSAFVAAVAGTDYLSPSSTIDGGTF